MSKTILIDDNETTRSVYSLNLSTYVGTEVVERKGPRDTIDLLEVLNDFDLIVTRPIVRGKDSPRLINEYLKTKSLTIPIIVLGASESPVTDTHIQYLQIPIQVKELIEKASKTLGVVVSEVMEKKVVAEYVPIPIAYFLLFDKTPCEVFIRINDVDGPKFIKRIHENDEISRAVILKYQDSGVKFLYIHHSKRFGLTDSFTDSLVSKMDDENLSIADRIDVTEKALDFVHNELRTLGFNEKTLMVSNSAMKSMMKSVKTTPSLADMLSLIQKNADGYMYQHCIMLNLVSCSIIQKISWATYEFLDKMSYISFFHDISLANPEWSRIHTIKDYQEQTAVLSERDKLNIREHAMRSAAMLEKEPTIPMGVAQVIKQHHGVLKGIGFTSSFSHNMAPLSIVFILAEHFVDSVLNHGVKEFNRQQIQDFYTENGKFPSSFEKTLDAFERAFS